MLRRRSWLAIQACHAASGLQFDAAPLSFPYAPMLALHAACAAAKTIARAPLAGLAGQDTAPRWVPQLPLPNIAFD